MLPCVTLGLAFLRIKDHRQEKNLTLICFLRKADAKMESDMQDIYWGKGQKEIREGVGRCRWGAVKERG